MLRSEPGESDENEIEVRAVCRLLPHTHRRGAYRARCSSVGNGVCGFNGWSHEVAVMTTKQHPALPLIRKAITNAGFKFTPGTYPFSFKVYDADSIEYTWLDVKFNSEKNEVKLIVDRLSDHTSNFKAVERALHEVVLAFNQPCGSKQGRSGSRQRDTGQTSLAI